MMSRRETELQDAMRPRHFIPPMPDRRAPLWGETERRLMRATLWLVAIVSAVALIVRVS